MQPKCSEMRLRCGGHGCRRWRIGAEDCTVFLYEGMRKMNLCLDDIQWGAGSADDGESRAHGAVI